MKRFFALCLALLTVLSFAGCSSGKADDAAEWFLSRYNALVTEMGFESYALSESDLTVKGDTFSGIFLSGLFHVEGKAKDGTLTELTVTFTDGLLEYVRTSEDAEAAVLESLYTGTMVVLALSEDYETLDDEKREAFLLETLVPSFTAAQRVGDYMLKSEFTDASESGCRIRLTLIG